jgi:hypothetical protein
MLPTNEKLQGSVKLCSETAEKPTQDEQNVHIMVDKITHILH